MAANRIPTDLWESPWEMVADPGSGGTFAVTQWAHCQLVSAGAEARTLPAPTRPFAHLLLYVKTAVGTITITVTGGLDAAGDTTIALTTAGQWVYFISVFNGTTYYWQRVSDYSIGNFTLAQSLLLQQITASAAEVNRNNQASTREVLAGATLTLSQALHDGKTVAMPAVCAITLPASSGSGSRYKLYQKIAATAVTITATAADLYGVAWALSDNSAAVLAYEAAGSTVITFDGSTKGGRKGHITELEDVAANLWQVRTMGAATGTEASPFS